MKKNDKQRYIISRRKILLNRLKKCGCDYKYSATNSNAYIGEGFYINHRQRCYYELPIWGYDIKWAYGGELKNNIFPLTSRLGKKPTELCLIQVFFSSFKKKYADEWYYSLYSHNIEKLQDGYTILLTHLDYEIFKYFYEIENEETVKLYYQDIGKLDVADIIDKAHVEKKSGKYPKAIFEAIYYGMFAKLLKNSESPYGYEKYKMAYAKTQLKDVREASVPIAVWQTAYTRYREFKYFLKYKDYICYMNTDSIYATKELDIPVGDNIGDYRLVYDGNPILFIRRNAYIVFNKDGSIKERVIGGVPDEENKDYISSEGVDILRKGESIRVKSYNKEKELIDIDLHPDFIQYHLPGKLKNIKYLL